METPKVKEMRLLINQFGVTTIEDKEQRAKIAAITGRDYIQIKDIPMLRQSYELCHLKIREKA